MDQTEITLLCGCEIRFYPPHWETCKCNDPDCRTGYWFMEEPCSKHEEKKC